MNAASPNLPRNGTPRLRPALDAAVRFKTVRQYLGLTTAVMSPRLGMVSAAAWSQYEGGHTWPSTANLIQLAAHGININWLLTGNGEMIARERITPHSAHAEIQRLSRELAAIQDWIVAKVDIIKTIAEDLA